MKRDYVWKDKPEEQKKIRLEILLDIKTNNKLEMMSERKGMSKGQIIRWLINKEKSTYPK